jgi:excisionase family DNA binding protein
VGEERTEGAQQGTEYLTVGEAAKMLGVHRNTIHNRIKTGRIKAHKVVEADREVYRIERDSLDLGRTSAHVRTLDDQRTNIPGELFNTLSARLEEIVRDYTHEMGEVREALGAERVRREVAEERIQDLEAQLRPPPKDAQKPRDPGDADLTIILVALSCIGVGSVPLLAKTFEQVSYLPLVLFALPIVLGLYRGIWHRRLEEYAQEVAARATSATASNEPDKGTKDDLSDLAVRLDLWALGELLRALVTALGTAIVTFLELLLWYYVIMAEDVPLSGIFSELVERDGLTLLWVIVATSLFYIFAVLLGAATGGQQDEHNARGGRVPSAPWFNAQFIGGLLGTIITAIATVSAAAIGG